MTDSARSSTAALGGSDAFVSYSRADRPAVRRLAVAVQERGRTLWVDWEGIPPTAEWMVEIREAIDAANAVIFVLSPTSLRSRVCRDELAFAEAGNKRIVPLVVDDVDAAQVPPALAKRNWLFLRDGDDVDVVADQLVEVLDIDLAAVKRHTRLTVRATEWHTAGRDPSGLLRGADLAGAEQWLATPGGGPAATPAQTTYVFASRQAASRRLRRLVVVVSAALVAALAMGGFAFVQRSTAVSQRDLARTQALASASLAALDRDPETSLLLALEATKTGRTPLVEEALRKAVLASHVERTFRPEHAKDFPGALTFSADGKTLYAGVQQGQVGARSTGRIVAYDLTSGRRVLSVAVPLDGFFVQGLTMTSPTRLVTATARLRFVDPTTGRNSLVPKAAAPDVPYYSLALSRDGQSLFTAASDGVAREIDATTGALIRIFGGKTGEVYDAQPSPDGATVAVSGVDGVVRLYDRRTGRVRSRLLVGSAAGAARWSPGGDLLLTTSLDRLARIWDVQTGKVVQQFGHAGQLNVATWIGDDYVATGDSLGVVRVWSVGSGDILSELRGQSSLIGFVAASPDASRLATSSVDGTVRVWRLGPNAPLGRRITAETVNGVDVTSDGRRVVSASYRGGTVLSDARTGHEVRVLDPAAVEAPRFSPDGTKVVTLVVDGPRPAVRLREASTGRLVWQQAELGTVPGQSQFEDPVDAPPRDRPAVPKAAAFSPDGSRLAVLTELGVRVLDAGDGRQLGSFTGQPATHDSREGMRKFGHEGSVEWAPDGSFLVVPDGRDVVVLDRHGKRELRRLTGHEDRVLSVAITPDGRQVVSTSWDLTARVWSLRDGHEVRRLDVRSIGLGVSTSPTGFVATTGNDGNLRVWNRSGLQIMQTRVAVNMASAVRFMPDGRHLLVGIGLGFDERIGFESPTGLRQSGAVLIVDCEVCRSYAGLVALGRSRVTHRLSRHALAEALGATQKVAGPSVTPTSASTGTHAGQLDRRLLGPWRTDLDAAALPEDQRSNAGPVLLRFFQDGTFWVWQDHSGPLYGTARTRGSEVVVRSEFCGNAEGRYSWIATGDQVRLTPVSDNCLLRRAQLSSAPLRRQ